MPSKDLAGFLPDQSSSKENSALTYTSNPWLLLGSDTTLFLSLTRYIPYILDPFRTSHPLDELYPSWANAYNLVLQAVTIATQLAFLLSIIPLTLFSPLIPFVYVVAYIIGFIVFNRLVCRLLNGTQAHLESNPALLADPKAHSNERWIFLNGVAGSHHWLQANVDKLSMTFGRPVLGVLNPTVGILFDLIQCLVQRDFGYATQDVRDAYVQVKAALYDPQYTKVVFIVHSQGAIEGGLILDWLLDEVPQNLLNQLEVYTFGNAANHFSNPAISASTTSPASSPPATDHFWDKILGTSTTNIDKKDKVIGYIEHYANNYDFVAQWGVLHFTRTNNPGPIPTSSVSDVSGTAKVKVASTNTFMGRVLVRPGTGHLLNQHYLQKMFTLNKSGKVEEHNPFMDMVVVPVTRQNTWGGNANGSARSATSPLPPSTVAEGDQAINAQIIDAGSPVKEMVDECAENVGCEPSEVRVRDLSRLWLYRNGMSPPS